jgi:DNA-directed RNA polymerase subunit beta'
MKKTISRDIKQIKIGLVSPREIQEWGEHSLFDGTLIGEVTSWETINYKTLQPEMDGLFCQRIFGPIEDYVCACGKRKKKKTKLCKKCGITYDQSRVRRYRFGHIKLQQPVVHSLYASYRPSPLGICLNWSNARLQNLIITAEFCHLSTIFLNFFPWYHLTSKIETILKTNNNIFLITPQNKKNSLIIRKFPKKYPKLFRKKSFFEVKNAIKDFEPTKVLLKNIYKIKENPTELLLYGIDYDMGWEQIENLQTFLYYNWAIPSPDQYFIPYYFFTKKIKDHNKSYQIREVSNAKNTHKFYKFQPYPIKTGGFVIERILSHYDPKILQKQLDSEHQKINITLDYIKEQLNFAWDKETEEDLQAKWNHLKQIRKKHLRRLGFFRKIYLNFMQPAWMILNCLPVLPPDLRPITKLNEQLFLSDLNHLYRKVLIRNKRQFSTNKFTIFDPALNMNWEFWCFNLRLLQESVDSLLQTGNLESDNEELPNFTKQENTVKSLLDTLKGKKGRFRQHLLGKRVDYSGRSVIVVGPTLKIYECGLPLEMAIELFQPFIIQKLKKKKVLIRTTSAKSLIAEHKDKIWNILKQIIKGHPILLNRAPTLHRLGIQAFFPKLVLGKAILLHPLVCPAFNADFDGDQMAVHIPLSLSSRTEALNLIWSRNNLLAPASGEPLLLPAQDMVLGCYYLTSIAPALISNLYSNSISINQNIDQNLKSLQTLITHLTPAYFFNSQNVRRAYEKREINIHTPIWIHWTTFFQNMAIKKNAPFTDSLLEYQVDCFENSYLIRTDRYKHITKYIYNYIRTTPGRIFFHEMDIKF